MKVTKVAHELVINSSYKNRKIDLYYVTVIYLFPFKIKILGILHTAPTPLESVPITSKLSFWS